MGTLLELQLLTPVDWPVLRAARLAALLDSPAAFTSNHAQESKWVEGEWRRVFDAATWIVALEAEKAIGLARSVGAAGHETRHVESIWVAPTHRQRGVCRALLHALAETERSMGVTDLLLWVLEDNHDAQRAYDALGFEPTGERQFLPDFGRFERRLRLGIGLFNVPAGREAEVHHSGAELG
jgi:ribosomal protein S18 acetylase RimI-like enzyme